MSPGGREAATAVVALSGTLRQRYRVLDRTACRQELGAGASRLSVRPVRRRLRHGDDGRRLKHDTVVGAAAVLDDLDCLEGVALRDAHQEVDPLVRQDPQHLMSRVTAIERYWPSPGSVDTDSRPARLPGRQARWSPGQGRRHQASRGRRACRIVPMLTAADGSGSGRGSGSGTNRASWMPHDVAACDDWDLDGVGVAPRWPRGALR